MVCYASVALANNVQAPTISEPKVEITETLKPTSLQIPPTTQDLKDYLYQEVAEYGLDYEKIYYTIQHESSFNPNAVGPRGFSIGLSQFTLDTWLGNCSNIDERKDGYKSIDCMLKLWARGEQWRWDAYCLHWYDEVCVSKRGLYPE